jgi:O-acetyl-ADP-ribose deacetylase (regulator of RNase III)
MVAYIKGDLLSSKATVIVHGCNAQKKMNSGVAKAVREKWPEVYKRYMETEYLKLGCVQVVRVGGQYIVNAITQDQYGYDGNKYVSYDAIDSCMSKLAKLFPESSAMIAMPKIGAGLGGGNWQVIETIINQHLKDRALVYVLDMDEGE